MSRTVLAAAAVASLALSAGLAQPPRRHSEPEGRLFISPMGEPFRSDRAGDPEAAWFAGADADHDGRISPAEFQADAMRWFLVADRGHDGEIDPDDIDYYENRLVPEIRVADAGRGGGRPSSGGDRGGSGGGPGGRMGGRGGGMGGGGHRGSGDSAASGGQDGRTTAARQGAARYSYLDLPEPLTAADANFNRGIDKAEMARAATERFALLDKNGDGYLEKRELPRVDTRSSGLGPRPGGLRLGEPPASGTRQLGGGDRDQD